MSEPTQAEMRRDLALAMGWTELDPRKWASVSWESPDGTKQKDAPDPFTSAADKDALVAWLAEDDARWVRFDSRLWELTPIGLASEHSSLNIAERYRRAYMTADCKTIALAAWRAVKEK